MSELVTESADKLANKTSPCFGGAANEGNPMDLAYMEEPDNFGNISLKTKSNKNNNINASSMPRS